MGEEPKFAPFRLEHLHAREIGTHDGYGGFQDRLVQRLGTIRVDQLDSDFLELPGGGKLRHQLPLGLTQGSLGTPPLQTEAELPSDGDRKG